MPEVEYGGRTFNYHEIRGRTRRIGISVAKIKDSECVYKFVPDPHKNHSYNNHQPEFYLDAAKAAARLFSFENEKPHWKNSGPFEWRGVEYTLEKY